MARYSTRACAAARPVLGVQGAQSRACAALRGSGPRRHPGPGSRPGLPGLRPHPEFAIGPLFVVASVQPDVGTVMVTLSFSLTTPWGSGRPTSRRTCSCSGRPSWATPPPRVSRPALVREVQQRGFVVNGAGGWRSAAASACSWARAYLPRACPRRPRSSRSHGRAARPLRSAPSTYIKIPWNPRLADPAGVIVLSLASRGLVTPKPATWFEELFWGRRWVLNVGFGDIGSPVMPAFPLYFEQRRPHRAARPRVLHRGGELLRLRSPADRGDRTGQRHPAPEVACVPEPRT